MPIKVPTGLPAADILAKEGVAMIGDDQASKQDIRPLKIALLNLMPLKEQTECQIGRLIGNTPLQLELTLLTTSTYESKNVTKGHLQSYYSTFEDVKDQKFDGFIITGAPIETLEFEDVNYWPELQKILDWSVSNVHSLFAICWGGQAALYHFHGVPKHELPEKRFGVYHHQNLEPTSPIMIGINDNLPVPVSRHTENREDDIPSDKGLRVLASSPDAGLCLLDEISTRRFYMFNHLEYDAETLKGEYNRDITKRDDVPLPHDYFPDDNPEKTPVNTWRSHAHMLYGNWINFIYQTTPYDINEIGKQNS